MASANETATPDRRKSGRTVRRPGFLADEQYEISIPGHTSSKRKRTTVANGVHAYDDPEESQEEMDEGDAEESEAGELQSKGQRRRKRAPASAIKPTAKRPKTNGASATLAIRPGGTSTKSKAAQRQHARSRPSQLHASGLFADVFGRGSSADEAASAWHETLAKDNVEGIRDLINLTFQAIGCDARIESSDVEDIDNVPSRLGDVLEEYAQQNSTDYPLISKSKQYVGFKMVLTEFFRAIILALHNSGLLYEDPAIYDNVHVWTATMSGANYRPFRHTATVISLTMSSALCEVAQLLQKSVADVKTQIDSEKKKRSTNQGRVKKMQEDMKRDEARLEAIDNMLKDAFDTVYAHRYRDVDEKIRVECVAALGSWIGLYRKMFLESQYLRYLGWVLSDPNAPTRLEVIRALKDLFKHKQNIGAMRAFTDRFRSRIVEMGSRDADTSVRADAIELLDRLRNAEYLEPDDIDTIGQLIFDNEPRVRKAVAKFFVSNIEDLYKASVEEFDEEQYNSTLLPVEDTDDFSDPCQSWIKYKCLAQTLAAHDRDSESRKSADRGQDVYGADESESRYLLATMSIFPYMADLQHWEALAGYLLYDHSDIPAQAQSTDINQAVRVAYKLENGVDHVLLDVLQLAVKLSLQQIIEDAAEKKGKRTNASKDEAQKKQEEAAHHLTIIIPQLLNKYGGAPDAAASILRLEQLLDIDLIQNLQSGDASYEKILEDINRQFTTHKDRKVLAEASRALRAARTYETSQEAVDATVAELWDESKETLRARLSGKNIPTRGTVDRNTLAEIAVVMARLCQLATVNDCSEVIESSLAGTSNKRKSKGTINEKFLDMLLQILHRGVYDEDTTATFAELEDRICGSVMTVLSFYFRWKVVALKSAILTKDGKRLSAGVMTNLAAQRNSFADAVRAVIASRSPLDSLRVSAILTLLDLYTLFATVRYLRPSKGDLDSHTKANLSNLILNIPPDLVKLILETHEKMEKRLARKTNRSIELPSARSKRKGHHNEEGQNNEDEDVERAPEDSDDDNDDEAVAGGSKAGSDEEGEDDEDDGDDDGSATAKGGRGREKKKQGQLIAEQALCELASKLVLATIGGVLDHDGTLRRRLQLNRHKLGKSYNQVIAYLDDKNAKKGTRPAAGQDGTPAGDKANRKQASTSVGGSARNNNNNSSQKKKFISQALIDPNDDIEDEEMEDQDEVEEGDEEDLRRRGLEEEQEEEDDDDNDNNNDDEEPAADADGEDIIGD